MAGQRKLVLSRLLSPSFTIVYKLPLGNAIQTWTTENFTQFVQKYSLLKINKVTINDVHIEWKGVKSYGWRECK